jgi:hypothetical protein
MRLACLYALLDCSDRIRRVHLEAALAVWRYCEASARYIFGDSLGNPLADDLYRLLKERPEGMMRMEMYNHYDRHRSSQEIAEALGVLAERGLAVCRKDHPSRGRAAERWFSIMPSAPAAPPCATSATSATSAEKAAENFESFFVSMLMNELQKTVSFSEKSFMEQNYMTIVNQKVSEFIAKKGLGIKDVLMRYLERGAAKVSPDPVDKLGNKDK